MIIKRVCAGCGKHLGSYEDSKHDPRLGTVSHGMCLPCLKIMSPEHYRAIRHAEAMQRGAASAEIISKRLARPMRSFAAAS
jgi:hypothetical protein